MTLRKRIFVVEPLSKAIIKRDAWRFFMLIVLPMLLGYIAGR